MVDVAAPPVDETGNDSASGAEEEVLDVDENLGDLGGAADDGEDDDPHKFIEKSLHFQDLEMTKRHANERVEFFVQFAETMPKGKSPYGRDGKGGKIAKFRERVARADKRISVFRAKYAKNREAAKAKRAERIAKEKEERKEEEALGKPLKSAIGKSLKKAQAVAAKAARDAVAALGEEAPEDKQLEAGMKAFYKALQKEAKGAATVAA